MNEKSSKSRSLILITVLIAVAILAASWFLLISPVLTGASEASTNAEAQEQTNANTEIEVNKLREQYTHIDEYTTQLETLQTQIPTAPLYPELQRMFSEIATKNHVVITSLQFGAAMPFAAAAPPPVVDENGNPVAPSASPSPSPSVDPNAPTDGAAIVVKAPSGMYGIPVSVTVEGTYDNVMSTLQELQTGDSRLVLVTTVTMTKGLVVAGGGLTGGGAGAGSGTATDADTTGVFGGLTYVLTSSTPTEEAPVDTSTSPSASPAP